MSIRYIKDAGKFIINTASTTYAFEVFGEKYLRHLYYGKRTSKLPGANDRNTSFAPYLRRFGWEHSPDCMDCEVSFFGSGDFRANSLRLLGADGSSVTDFSYDSYKIFKGRHDLDGLPAARPDSDTQTLQINMTDPVTGCILRLCYTVFPKSDVISRYMILENKGGHPVKIEKCMPLELSLAKGDLDMVTLYGSHCKECTYQRFHVHHGLQSTFSRRGASSHQHNPFMAICDSKATEEKGDVYGFNLVYSGSYLNEVELDQLNTAKVLVGLGSETFAYTVNPGESFTSPEAVMTYSAAGFGKMSRNFHSFTRNNIMPEIAGEPHPVVLNTWEACYFDIDEAKLIDFAKEAKKTGFDMLVMDDGWFGKRNNDRAGLGDWFENRDKFPDGLKAFVRRVKAQGIKFGIWVEPEMVNPDSDLYRAHPEWALTVPGREPLLSRAQLVLDMSNPEVVDYLIEIFDKTFDGVELDYFKWDMNRHMSNVYSSCTAPDKQCEVHFRYMKGVYRLLRHFAEKYPDAVIETCSGGGGRYDLGMMQYGIQIWTSDNTNPYDRTYIQSAAVTAYPAMTMSCHVSDPHGDMKSLDYRYKVALGGMLGYELNILEMSEEIKAEIARQITEYRSFEHVIRTGDFYRLASPVSYGYSSYCYVTEDSSEILLTLIETAKSKPGKTKLLRIKRAEESAVYTEVRSGKTYSGAELRHGLSLETTGEKDTAEIYYFKKNA